MHRGTGDDGAVPIPRPEVTGWSGATWTDRTPWRVRLGWRLRSILRRPVKGPPDSRRG